MWISVGVVALLIAATFAIYQIGGRTTPRRVGNALATTGSLLAVVGLLGPWGLTFDPFGIETADTFLILFGTGAAIFAAGQLLRRLYGVRAKEPLIPVMGVTLAGLSVVLVALWTVSLPWPDYDAEGVQVAVTQQIATTTKVPWTVIFILSVLMYLVLSRTRRWLPEGSGGILAGVWALSFPVLFLVILRDPGIDYSDVLQVYLPSAVGFLLIGGLLLNFVADARGELDRVIGGVLLVSALASFFFSVPFVVRFSLLGLAMFALAAPTFGGKGTGRRIFLGVWAGYVVSVSFFVLMLASESTVSVAGNSSPFGGLLLTILLSSVAIVLSLPLGIMLALGRSSRLPIFRLMSTAYIELIRGVPLITWLIVAFIMLPVALPQGIEIGGVARAIGAMSLFSAAYLAENVRGGLQSIPKGQYEASQAMGLTITQTTVFIVLPQALRAVIPALVGQVIALFKDTSLVTIVGLFDFLHIARQVIPGQAQPFNFIGVFREPLLFAAVVYWMFTFTFSRISLRLEKKLGVGER